MNRLSSLFASNNEDQLKYNDISIIDKISIQNKSNNISNHNKYHAMNYINQESIQKFQVNEENVNNRVNKNNLKDELQKLQETNKSLDIEIELLTNKHNAINNLGNLS